jgi:hypothetical protein
MRATAVGLLTVHGLFWLPLQSLGCRFRSTSETLPNGQAITVPSAPDQGLNSFDLTALPAPAFLYSTSKVPETSWQMSPSG